MAKKHNPLSKTHTEESNPIGTSSVFHLYYIGGINTSTIGESICTQRLHVQIVTAAECYEVTVPATVVAMLYFQDAYKQVYQ